MKVLFLGPADSPLCSYLEQTEGSVISTTERLSPGFLSEADPEFLVSYGYRHIIKADVLERFPDRAVNLHISLLPWNRGADPNLWSFVDDTPKGVTIHYLDAGVDTGDVIAQRELFFAQSETLRTTYDALQREIQSLFREHWPAIRVGGCRREKQKSGGSAHRLRDKEAIAHLLTAGWETPVGSLKAARRG
jgi:methionyl-tRNA formyltransferase